MSIEDSFDNTPTEYFLSFKTVRKVDPVLIQSKGLVIALTMTINNVVREVMRQYMIAGRPVISEELIVSLFDSRPGAETNCIIEEKELGDLEIIPEFEIDNEHIGVQVTLRANLEAQSIKDLQMLKEELKELTKYSGGMFCKYAYEFRTKKLEEGYGILEHFKFDKQEDEIICIPLTLEGAKLLVRNKLNA